jgi:RNA polymerase sigma factor for flagellar operon FliA
MTKNEWMRKDMREVSQTSEGTTAMIPPATTGSINAEPKDQGNFHRLLEEHLPLVQSTVYRMRLKLPDTIEADELHSIGLSGLIAAVQRYQPSRQKSFAGYAATRIRGAILDELRRQDSMSRYSRAKAKRLGSAISKLQQEQGTNYSRDSLCVEKNMSEEELAGLMEEVRPVSLVSLDEVDSADYALHETIPDDCCVSAPDALERKEIITLLVERMAQLPEMQKKVLAMYYYENMQLSEIAALFGVTESRICQIRGQAVATLRKYVTKLLA